MRRMASAIGTSTACAQYRTTTTSTHPANVTHGFKVCSVLSIGRRSATINVSQFFHVQKGTDIALCLTQATVHVQEPVRDPVSGSDDRTPARRNARQAGGNMDTNTLLIILVVLLVLGGGGFFYRRRV